MYTEPILAGYVHIISLISLRPTLFSYLMVAGAIDWNICPEVLGMTKGFSARGHRPSAIEPLVIPRTKWQMFQFIAPETIK
jgi:hypothetical protein